MSEVQVKILKTVVTAVYGTLGEGSLLRTSPEFAEHLVKECGAAEYVAPVAAAVTDVPEVAAKAPAAAKPKPANRKGAAAASAGAPSIPVVTGQDDTGQQDPDAEQAAQNAPGGGEKPAVLDQVDAGGES